MVVRNGAVVVRLRCGDRGIGLNEGDNGLNDGGSEIKEAFLIAEVLLGSGTGARDVISGVGEGV